jgi:hypothetical protein
VKARVQVGCPLALSNPVAPKRLGFAPLDFGVYTVDTWAARVGAGATDPQYCTLNGVAKIVSVGTTSGRNAKGLDREDVVCLARSGAGEWCGEDASFLKTFVDVGRVFKHGEIVRVSPRVCRVVHHRAEHDYSALRMRQIRDNPETALPLIEGALATGGPTGRSAARAYCRMLLEEEQYELVRRFARRMVRKGFRGDGNMVLAELAYLEADKKAVIRYAERAIEFAEPNPKAPLDHIVRPRALLAHVLAELGRTDEALTHARKVLSVQPDHPGMAPFKQVLMVRESMRALLWTR